MIALLTACLFIEILVHVLNCIAKALAKTVFGHLNASERILKYIVASNIWKMAFSFRDIDICNRNLRDTGYLVKNLQWYGVLRPPLMGPQESVVWAFNNPGQGNQELLSVIGRGNAHIISHHPLQWKCFWHQKMMFWKLAFSSASVFPS